jgi:hypothetical protein
VMSSVHREHDKPSDGENSHSDVDDCRDHISRERRFSSCYPSEGLGYACTVATPFTSGPMLMTGHSTPAVIAARSR